MTFKLDLLDGVDSEQPKGGREILFFALLLDDELLPRVTKRVELTCQAHGFTCRPIAAERLHISLLGFGDYSEERVELIRRVAATVRFRPVEISLDRAMSFKVGTRAQHPFVLTSQTGVDQVRELYRLLETKFSDGKPDARFNPHLTLVWDPKVITEYALAKPLTWTAREFVLVRSFQGRGRYEIVDRWPLVEGV